MNPIAADRHKGESSFAALIRYQTEASKSSPSPSEEPCIAFAPSLNFSRSGLPRTPESVAIEMKALAAEARSRIDPVYHFILSWPNCGEPPWPEMVAAATLAIESMSLAEHQYVIAAHHNTDQIHLHVSVNLIHPATLSPASMSNDWARLHYASRLVELTFNWPRDRGAYEIIEIMGRPHITRRPKLFDQFRLMRSKGAILAENWTGDSFQRHIADTVGASVGDYLLLADSTWGGLHDLLAGRGLGIKPWNGGGIIFNIADPKNHCHHAKCSHLGGNISWTTLIKQLGDYEDPGESARAAPPTPNLMLSDLYTQWRSAHGLEALQRRRSTFGIGTRLAEAGRAELEATCKVKSKARALRRDAQAELMGDDRELALMATKVFEAHQISAARIAAAMARGRISRAQSQGRLTGFLPWLQARAEMGDAAASDMLRAMKTRAAKGNNIGKGCVIAAATPALDDTPLIRSITTPAEVTSHRHMDGALEYRLPGRCIFIDRGSTIEISDLSQESLQILLDIARVKWPRGIEVRGPELFKARVAVIASEIQLKVVNPELRGITEPAKVKHEAGIRTSVELEGDTVPDELRDRILTDLPIAIRQIPLPPPHALSTRERLFASRMLDLPRLLKEEGFEQSPGNDADYGLCFVRTEGNNSRTILARQLDTGEWRWSEIDSEHPYGAHDSSGDAIGLLRRFGRAPDHQAALSYLSDEIALLNPEVIRQALARHDEATNNDHTALRQRWTRSHAGMVSGYLAELGISDRTMAWAGDAVRCDAHGNALFRHCDSNGSVTGYEMHHHHRHGELAHGGIAGVIALGSINTPLHITIIANAIDALAHAQMTKWPEDTLYVSGNVRAVDQAAASHPESAIIIYDDEGLAVRLRGDGRAVTIKQSPKGGWRHMLLPGASDSVAQSSVSDGIESHDPVSDEPQDPAFMPM